MAHNMRTHGLPDMYSIIYYYYYLLYTRSPQTCGPWALGVHIRQTMSAHVTTITCTYVCVTFIQ